MTKALILVFSWLMCALAAAQDAQPTVNTAEQQANKVPPIVSFTMNYPAGSPPFYSISVESNGRTEYRSTLKPQNQGDSYVLTFVASESTRAKLFELARQLNFFHGNFDYTRNKVAFTGTKTLAFKNADEEHKTSYNWSENPQIQEITTIFQNMEETIELGRQLEDKYRFDKLGVDAILKILEQDSKDNRLAEIQAIQPILNRVAKDPAMMNISRRRAEILLSKIPKGVTTGTNGQQ